MANKFSLIDIIDESSKVSRSNLDSIFESLDSSESDSKKSLGIRDHWLKEMDFDFSSGPDAGEDEDDFRHAASQGEFDDEEDPEGDEEMGDEEDPEGDMIQAMGDEDDAENEKFAIGGYSGPNISDTEAREKHPDRYADMVDSYDSMGADDFDPNAQRMGKFNPSSFMSKYGFRESKEMYGHMKKPGYNFTKHPSDKGKKSKGKQKNESVLSIITGQVNKMGGKRPSPKVTRPQRDDYVIAEMMRGSNKFVIGKIASTDKGKAKVKIGEAEGFIGFSSMIPAQKSKNEELRKKAKEFKTNHPKRNIWISGF